MRERERERDNKIKGLRNKVLKYIWLLLALYNNSKFEMLITSTRNGGSNSGLKLLKLPTESDELNKDCFIFMSFPELPPFGFQ